MSYDIGFYVKTVVPNLEGDRYALVHVPKYDKGLLLNETKN